MALPVVTVASGGLPVVDMTATAPKFATPVTEAANGRGVAVTQVAARGMPVVYAYIGGDVPPVTSTIWNSADIAKVTLSNGSLTATTNGSSSPVGARAVAGLSSGKRYFEVTMTVWNGTGAIIGLATATAILAGGQNAGQAVVSKAVTAAGGINIDGSYSGSNLGTRANGDIIGIAVDLTARLIWFRAAPAGNWNGSGTANPGTGAGGLSIAALSGALFPFFGAGAIGETATANFGASAFSGAVPAGFTGSWG
jgi:hypothetical protein